jgi:hypothetical protein
MVGLCLGGGLLFASYRMRCRLQSIEDARPCKAGNPGSGLVKLHGTAKAVDPGRLLTSPIEQKPCVYYRLVIEEYRQNTFTSGHILSQRSRTSGTWVPIIEDVQAVPMVIADETGAIDINPKEAQLDFQLNRRHANMFSSLPKELEESLREKYKIVTTGALLAKQMRYSELVIEQDQEVFVVGECAEKDGKPSLTKKEHPLLITFRNEKQVLRNGMISVVVMKVLAVVFPLIFLGLAVGVFFDQRSHQQALQATNDPLLETYGKLKSPSLSERATAARKLAESPVVKERVNDVSPYLNALLESNTSAQRDSALQAIKQGWGSKANEPALRRLQESNNQMRVQKDVAAALKAIGVQ